MGGVDRGLSCMPTCADKHTVLALFAPYLTQEIVAAALWYVCIKNPANARLADMKVSEVVLEELAHEVGELWSWVG